MPHLQFESFNIYSFGMVKIDDIICIYVCACVYVHVTLTTFAPLELVEYIILQMFKLPLE